MADPAREGITSQELGLLVDISHILNPHHDDDYLQWNAATSRIADAALQQAIFEPLQQHDPGRRCSNDGSYLVLRQHVVPTAHGAHPQWRESDGFGTHQGAHAHGLLTDDTGDHIMLGSSSLGAGPCAIASTTSCTSGFRPRAKSASG